MAYKRYIKRGDKVYGPYVYHSRKVNGKVVSEYHGTSKRVDRKKKQKVLINSLKLIGLILFSLFLIYLAFISMNEELRIEDFLGERFSITGYAIGADECGTLSSPGTYTLNSSVSSSGTCFTITSDNVTLDCDNFWINYSSGGGPNQYGVYASSVENVTIKNCNIVDAYWASGATRSRYGIYFLYSNYSTLEDNFVNTYNSSAIYLKQSYNNSLTSNNGTVEGSESSIRGAGINFWIASDNNLTNNFGTSTKGPGIVLAYSENNILTNNTGIANGNIWDGSGIFLNSDSNFNNLTNNTGIGEYYPGISIGSSSNNRLVNNSGTGTINTTGIMLSSNVNHNVLINNTGRGYGTDWASPGIMLYVNVSNNILTNNIGVAEDYPGIYLYVNASNNLLTGNTAISNGSDIFLISNNCSNNVIRNNTFISGDGDGTLFAIGTSSMNNTVYYNNFTETTGIYITNSHSNNDTQFNTTVGGEPRGNYYFNITSLNIIDSDDDGWGDGGSDYPLNATSWSAKWEYSGTDWGPATTGEATYPLISVVYPTATNYSVNVSELNYTYTEINPDKCWWSNSSGEWNSSTQACGTNWTSLISSEGWNNWTVYINDTSGNENSSSVDFFKDTTSPEVEIVSPTSGQTFTSSTVSFSVKINEASDCNYTLNAGATNNTMTANATSTGFTDSQSLSNAAYTALFYCDDLVGNSNNTQSVSFTVNVDEGGGGGGGSSSSSNDFTIPETYEKTVSLGKEEIGAMNITNLATSSGTFNIKVESLEEFIIFGQESVDVDARDTKQIYFGIISPNETGIYTGKIIVSSGSITKEMLVVLSVVSEIIENESFLFDATMRIPFFMRVRKLDSNLLTNINLLQIGAEEEVDVVLEYVIKDFEDTVHFTESEETLIYKEKAFDKSFDLKGLPEGEYVVGLEVIYQNGVAVASSQFDIKSRTLTLLEILGGILMLVILILLVVLLFIIRKRKRFVIKPYK